jgi:hypothetical protein
VDLSDDLGTKGGDVCGGKMWIFVEIEIEIEIVIEIEIRTCFL